MSDNNFLNKENIRLLWDVISDEEIFKFLSRDKQSTVARLFETNLMGFYNSESIKTNNLVDINKKYILLILKYIKDTFPQQPSRIKIHNDQPKEIPIKELITVEEIQNDRQSQFEKDLTRRQNEFSNAMTIQAPPAPKFDDKYEDKPITDMEKIIQEMTAQRNYDVDEISKKNIRVEDSDAWLKPQETSVKNEKFQYQQPVSENKPFDNVNNGSRLKYLKIENDEITLNKRVTFGENITMEYANVESDEDAKIEENIFSRLKQVQPKPSLQKKEQEEEQEQQQSKKYSQTNEDKIMILQEDVRNLKNTVDTMSSNISLILNMLQNKS